MALQTSGAISLNDIHVEAGGSSGSSATINDSDIRGLIGKSSGVQMSFSEWYGAANEITLTSAATINGQSNRKQITASTYVSSGGTLIIPSNFWVWSDSTSVAALIIDTPCTIKNYGNIIGKGGNGGNGRTAGTNGGPAINVTSSGVTIINYSGAYIAGGGGGGSGYESGGGSSGGGGGGAGGGAGGEPTTTSGSGGGGAGGILNAAGSDGADRSGLIAGNIRTVTGGGGGGAGGAGGYQVYDAFGSEGGGGGRILPGVGGAGSQYKQGATVYDTGPAGASGGDAGANANSSGGAGGGWGAAGGSGYAGAGGSGGAAITGTSRTLTNNGTIYGST